MALLWLVFALSVKPARAADLLATNFEVTSTFCDGTDPMDPKWRLAGDPVHACYHVLPDKMAWSDAYDACERYPRLGVYPVGMATSGQVLSLFLQASQVDRAASKRGVVWRS